MVQLVYIQLEEKFGSTPITTAEKRSSPVQLPVGLTTQSSETAPHVLSRFLAGELLTVVDSLIPLSSLTQAAVIFLLVCNLSITCLNLQTYSLDGHDSGGLSKFKR